MKKICCAAVLLLVSLFGTVHAAQAASSAVPRRIAVVRMQTLYQESRAGTGAMAWMQELQVSIQKKFEDMQARKALADEAGDEATGEAIQLEMQALLYSLQNTINTEQERIFALMDELVKKNARRYMEENSFAAILPSESAVAFVDEIDVTAEVIALMDRENLDFGPKPALELPSGSFAPAEAAPEETAPASPEPAGTGGTE